MKQETILVLEPNLLIRHPLAEYLRQCGYRVVEAATGVEARQLLDRGAQDVDIVLAAVDTPGESGFALAAWLRQAHPTVEVILAGTVERACEKAGDLCEQGPGVVRPYDHQLLLQQIRRHRARRLRSPKTPSDEG
ncbi:MAG TPA: response regulator [Rhodopila sp.]|nr:response regulator [Rhodopila sp.]